jgi:non-ribosomal peptide synthetase component E (peptide arylation enzyme)
MPRLTLRKANDGSVAADIGKPLPEIQLKVNSDNELQFRSPYGAVGEVNDCGFCPVDPEMWVSTGDLACQKADGHWELLGRANEVFKRYGEKISLLSLQNLTESVLSTQAAFYIETDSLGEQGCVLVLSPQPAAKEVNRLLLELRKMYPRTHWPLRIESTETMPLLPNGKIDILALSTLENTTVHWRQRI